MHTYSRFPRVKSAQSGSARRLRVRELRPFGFAKAQAVGWVRVWVSTVLRRDERSRLCRLSDDACRRRDRRSDLLRRASAPRRNFSRCRGSSSAYARRLPCGSRPNPGCYRSWERARHQTDGSHPSAVVFLLSAQSCCSRKPRRTVPRIRPAENLRPVRDRPVSNGRRMGAPRCGSLHRSRGSSWIRSRCRRTAACLLAPADSCGPGAASGRSRFRRHGSRGWSFLASSRHICPASERIPSAVVSAAERAETF